MRIRSDFCIAILMLLGLGFFSFGWNNPFVFDDIVKIKENPDLRPGSELWKVLVYPYQEETLNWVRNDPSRPLVFFFYKSAYLIGDGATWPFRLMSSLFHSGCAVLVFLLTNLFSRRLLNHESEIPGLLAGIYFLLTPVNAGTALYAYAFSDILSSFLILSVLAIHAHKPLLGIGQFIFCLGLFFLSLFSKQSSIVLPALLALTDFLLRQFDRKRALQSLGYLAMAGFYLAFRAYFFGGIGDLEGSGSTIEIGTYLQMQGLIIWNYLLLLLAPLRLALDHAPNPEKFNSFLLAIAWLLLGVTTVTSAYILWSKESAASWKFAAWFWLFWLATLLPTSSFLPTVDLFVERRAYLGSAALSIFFFSFVLILPLRKVALASAGIYLLGLSVISWGRVGVYSSQERLWKETLSLYPDHSRGQINLGVVLADQEQWAEAKNLFEKVLKAHPDSAFVHGKLALIYQNPKFAGSDPQSALIHYQKALALEPGEIVTRYNYGIFLLANRKPLEAEAEFRQILRLSPNFLHARKGLAFALKEKGLANEARLEFQKVLELDPNDPDARKALESASLPN